MKIEIFADADSVAREAAKTVKKLGCLSVCRKATRQFQLDG
jgi:hypothetical protein